MFVCQKLFGCVQNGATALYIASKEGHYRVVRMLLEAKADVNIKTNVSHAAWWCLCILLIPWLSVCILSPLCTCMSGLSSGECTISWSSCNYYV